MTTRELAEQIAVEIQERDIEELSALTSFSDNPGAVVFTVGQEVDGGDLVARLGHTMTFGSALQLPIDWDAARSLEFDELVDMIESEISFVLS